MTTANETNATKPKAKATTAKRAPRKGAVKASSSAETFPAVITPVERSFSLIQTAVERGASPEELHALMDIRREVQAEMAAAAFREAKSGFLSALPIIKKQKVANFPGKNGGMVTYKYASLDDIVETIKPYLKQYGLSYSWEQQVTENGMIVVTCILTHVYGHSERCSMQGGLDQSGAKNHLQMLCSSSSYMRRYTLTGVAGIATADEDIDGRLPDGGKSETLDGILNADQSEQQRLSDEIMAASTMAELQKAGAAIAELKEGRIKEDLKAEWFEAKSLIIDAEKHKAEKGE